jgi:hypothetical protein
LLYSDWVFGLSGGEIFIVTFVTVAVISARYWPALGERIALRLSGAVPRTVSGSVPPSAQPTPESPSGDPPRE